MRRALPYALILVGVLLATLPLRAEEPAAPAPVPRADDAAVERLIDALGSSDFAARERASRELLALGEKARPALERTMKSSDNMEARWRAEQILRRMDREGERPMGQGAEEPLQPPAGPGVLPPAGPRVNPPGAPPLPPTGFDEIERRFEEMRRRLFDGFGRGLGDFGPGRERLEAPGLTLDAEVFAGMLVQVTVLDREEGSAYRGRGLEDILARHPELEGRPGMAALKEKWAAYKQANPHLFEGGFGRLLPRNGITFSQSSEGIEVVQGPDGVTVRLRELDENGEEHVRELKGATLDEIREKHPELAGKLDGFGGFRVQLGPVQIFRGRGGARRLPLPVVPPAPKTEVTPSEDDAPAPFGVTIVGPEPVLAVHLGLEPGHGALVTQVSPDSQAAGMGLERYDVIVAVNGEPVTDTRQTAARLRAAARAQAPLHLDVIRRGVRTTLER